MCEEKTCPEKSETRFAKVQRWVTLIAASLAILGYFRIEITTEGLKAVVRHQGQAIQTLEDRVPQAALEILSPTEGESVGSQVIVKGSSTVTPKYRYVFIAVKSHARGQQRWKIVGQDQPNVDGKWSQTVYIDFVEYGSNASIRAELAARPDAYRVGAFVDTFPGPEVANPIQSNVVTIKRIQ